MNGLSQLKSALVASKYQVKRSGSSSSLRGRQSIVCTNNATRPQRILKFVFDVQLKLYLKKEDKKAIGKWMKEEISQFGPAFIKLGQFLSTRQTLFGKEISKELSYLQDDICPVDSAVIKEIIAKSLPGPFDEIFEDFEDQCIGSASIGQVHRARLTNKSTVAIKVQKPNIARQIQNDLDTMRNLVTLFQFLGNPRAVEFNNIMLEYERYLSAELDYINEVKNTIDFYNSVRDLPIRVPRVYTKLSSESIIVMEYIPSTKITDVQTLQNNNIDIVKLANVLIDMYVTQIIKNGILHADPHPGNIGVAEDGCIVLYDFGNVVRFTETFRSSLSQLIFATVQKDVNEFVDLLIKLDIITIYDENEIEEIKSFFMYFFTYLETLDFVKLKASIVQEDIQGKFQENLRINPDFMSLFRVFALLDGTCGKLNPKFSYIDVLTPYNEELLQDISFIDVRARKDLQKMRGYTQTIQNTYSTSVKTQNKLKRMQNEFQNMKYLVAVIAIIDNTEHVIPVVLILLAYNAYVQQKK
jgi:predicted unusual protein kinase regulating ubiquinone biosynthesis (AarF/ABC1/UbiB family)